MIDLLRDRYRLLAINLFGYGETTPWSGKSAQTLYAQAQLVLAICKELEEPIHIIGHSFGGSVAMKTAILLGQKVGCLVLLEPNPFYLLKQNGRMRAYQEVRELCDHVKYYGSLDEWPSAAERFADYWLGDGAWKSMSDKRRYAFVDALKPNFFEWDGVMGEETTVEELKALNTRTMVISDQSTRFPILEIVDILTEACPHWTFQTIREGGHMAAITHPEIVNPIIREFLITG